MSLHGFVSAEVDDGVDPAEEDDLPLLENLPRGVKLDTM